MLADETMSIQINNVSGAPIPACASISANGYDISVSTIFSPPSLMVFNASSRGMNHDIFGTDSNVSPSAENIQKALIWCLDQA